MGKKDNKEKFSVERIKFSSSFMPPVMVRRVMPKEKQKAEFAVTMLFSQILLGKGHVITKIELNKNDENKGADTIITLDGVDKGIQLTKFVPDDYLRRQDVGPKRSYQLASLIQSKIKKIHFKINIYIYPPDRKSIPRNKAKLDLKLADFISRKIEEYKEEIEGSTRPVFISVEDTKLSEIAKVITLNYIPPNRQSTFPGKENVYVSFEFDANSFDSEQVTREVGQIFQRKDGGEADFLLIWADRSDLIHQEEEIFSIIKKKFMMSTFEQIYFLAFFDREDLFASSILIYEVKEDGA